MPWCASSKRPVLRAMAPVNAPFSWPNNSLSSSPRGMAAQFTFTKVWSRRALMLWMARAMSSLPVPVSPRIRTVESVGATMATCFRTFFSAALEPMISSKFCPLRISSFR